jgi:hypothetical protein
MRNYQDAIDPLDDFEAAIGAFIDEVRSQTARAA